jgi:S1-C subfamily serine protease
LKTLSYLNGEGFYTKKGGEIVPIFYCSSFPPLSTLLMLATTGLIWWRFPPPSFVPWISVAALPTFSFGWTRFLKWLQSKTFRADTADSLFPHRKRTVFPLDAVVSIICHDGSAGNGFIIRYDGWIVTAHHVVEGEGRVWVALANGDLAEGGSGPPKTGMGYGIGES